jgi:hypothetical protein
MIWATSVARQIYQRLFTLCGGYTLPEPWSHLLMDVDVRACPASFSKTLEQLAETFPAAALETSGVATRASDGALVPAAALSDPGTPIVFLRPRPDVFPVEVVTAAGCLCGRHLPATAILSDHRTLKSLIRRHGVLLVTFNIHDMLVLRGLGFAATLATGLECLGPKQLSKVRTHFGWTRRSPHPELDPYCSSQHQRAPQAEASPRSTHHESQAEAKCAPASGGETGHVGEALQFRLAALPAECGRHAEEEEHEKPESPSLIFVGWSPSELVVKRPPKLDEIKVHLRAIQDALHMEDMDIGVWVPERTYLERLRLQLSFHPREVSAEDLFADIEESAGDLMFDGPEPPPSPPTNYDDAQQALRHAFRAFARGKIDSVHLSQASDDFETWLQKEILEPLTRSACPPRKRNLRAVLLHLSRLVHRLGFSIDEGLAQMPAELLLRSPELISPSKLDQYCRLIDKLIAVSKEIGR